ncbi:MAG TPA: hypothetical protein VGR62_16725 [Candidatus Binatia bacterium]|jgi:hypothetical protein|nr:hypothetical protein [Candidatus Binatia bacterium]
MELSEDLKYRLSYLTLRLTFDRLLSKLDDPGKKPAMLEFLDLLAGTHLAGEAAGKRYASQRDKIESFIDAEFDENILALINKAIDEIG